MVAKSPAELIEDMPAGIVNAVEVGDIHNIIHTMEARTSKKVVQISGNYTVTDDDDLAKIEVDSPTGITLTIPTTIKASWECVVIQKGAGAATVSVAGSPPRSRAGHTKTAGQDAVAYIAVTTNPGTAPVVFLGGDTAT